MVGGGVAGLAAACALAQDGYAVELFERRPYVGGRASSYLHPGVGRSHRQLPAHRSRLLHQCSGSAAACGRGRRDALVGRHHVSGARWQADEVEAGAAAGAAPQHAIVSGGQSTRAARQDGDRARHSRYSFEAAGRKRIVRILRSGCGSTGQTKRAVEHFWKPVLFSALNEDPDRISVRYAAKVFREAFLFSAEAGRMGVPRVPLSEMYGRVAAAIERAGGKVHLRSTVGGTMPRRGKGRWRLRVGEIT